MYIYYVCVLLAVTIWIFIWFKGNVPSCEKSFGPFALSLGVVYLFSSVVGFSVIFSVVCIQVVGLYFVVLAPIHIKSN